MEPTAIYLKGKRTLGVFSGLLALVTLGGIEARNIPDASLLPIEITNPGLLQHVLFVITTYCLYQYWLSWTYQADAFRDRSTGEYATTLGFTAAAYGVYLQRNAFPAINNILDAIAVPSLTSIVVLVLGIVAAVMGGLVSIRL